MWKNTTRAAMKRIRKKFSMPKKKAIGLVKVGNTNYRVGTSKSEKEWLDKLGVRERQKVIFGFGGKILVVDGIDYENKTVYEYNGEQCHSIRAYPKEKWDVKTWMGKTPREMYMATLHRFSFLYAMGWKVFFVWHKDFKKGLMGRYYRGPQDDLY